MKRREKNKKGDGKRKTETPTQGEQSNPNRNKKKKNSEEGKRNKPISKAHRALNWKRPLALGRTAQTRVLSQRIPDKTLSEAAARPRVRQGLRQDRQT